MPSQMAVLPAVTYLPKAPRSGVITVFGCGIKVRVDRGHLVIEDGIADERYAWRLARVGHGLKRLVVISSDGYVSLSAIDWLAAQGVALIVMEWDGRVLGSAGPPPGLDDARLRRAQAFALQSGVGLQIARELIDKKLAGQERVARERLKNYTVADMVARFRKALPTAKTIEAVGLLESQAAAEYWSAWEAVRITFPRNDLKRVPDHWRTFGSRRSPISGSQRLAANPVNGILNYLYALLEAEARLAVSAVGLDAGLGFIHLDTKARASLADDIMEAVRPQVDDFVLDWISRVGLKRDWFIEKEDGNVRLMGPFAAQLSESSSMWYRAVSPFAEWVARTLWTTMKKGRHEAAPATRLTQRRKREAKGMPGIPPAAPVARPQSICRVCGKSVSPGRRLCPSCAVPAATDQIMKELPAARIAGHSAETRARVAATMRRSAAARWSWDPSSQPPWLTEETYLARIQPLLTNVPTSQISSALGVSWVYAKYIRLGHRRPHPRHWVRLAQLVGVSAGGLRGAPWKRP